MEGLRGLYGLKQGLSKRSIPSSMNRFTGRLNSRPRAHKFMDAYSGYNQIKMSEPDMEATSFVIDQGTYCYKVMPFGLKNAGATIVDYSLQWTIPFEYLEVPNIHEMEPEVVVVINVRENWMEEIIDYIRDGKLAEDRNMARKLFQKASRYTVIRGNLYWRSYSEPHSLSVTLEVNLKILNDIHFWVYENHVGGRLLAQKEITASYYWPIMRQDATNCAQTYNKCQRYALMNHQHKK